MNSPPVILLVDDSVFFLTLEKQFLKKFPVAVREVRSSGEALAALGGGERPDLIFMAHDLPDLSGAECLRRLRTVPELRSIPVVLICDEKEPETAEICRAAAPGGVLTKPLDRHQFMEMGRRFLPSIREHRQTCLFQLDYRIEGERSTGKCLDLSNGGLFVETQDQPEPGTALHLSFVLPGQPPVAIEATGKVAWLNTRTDPRKPNYPVGFGVRFAGLGEAMRLAIRDFLQRKGSS
jgi:uncharacterized protein (TIGR02266 family)